MYVIVYTGPFPKPILVGLFATPEAAAEHLTDEKYVEGETGWSLPGHDVSAVILAMSDAERSGLDKVILENLVDVNSVERRQQAA